MPAETQDNFKTTKSNITPLKSEKASSSTVPKYFNGIMESRINTGDFTMSQETYTKTEIDLKLAALDTNIKHGFETTDLKLEALNQKTDLKFKNLEKQLDLKFDSFEHRIENMFSDLKNDLAKEKIETLEREKKDKRELILWSIGTAIAIIAIIVPLLL